MILMVQPGVMTEATRQPDEKVLAAAHQVAQAHQTILKQMQRVIVGQQEVIDLMLLGMFCRGHCLLEGVPGLAKTLMISSVSQLLRLKFGRIQFTPDLMPSDITGTEILQEDKTTGQRQLHFMRGPVFANIILADEINRTPPKTQAALLEAMQEHHVTVAGQTFLLEEPFFVLGTQNPIESEGTYPLPEAQLDRFMFKIHVAYPPLSDEIEIAVTTTSRDGEELKPVLSGADILKIQQVVRQVIVAHSVASYAVRLVRATRPKEPDNSAYVRQYLTWGAGPRACQALLLGAKAKALLDGRTNASLDDIRYLAKPVLRHRLVTSFAAESEGVDADNLVDQILHDLPETV